MTLVIVLDSEGKKVHEEQSLNFIPHIGEKVALYYDNGQYIVRDVKEVVHIMEKNTIIIITGDFRITPSIQW